MILVAVMSRGDDGAHDNGGANGDGDRMSFREVADVVGAVLERRAAGERQSQDGDEKNTHLSLHMAPFGAVR
jgi:hypothetical protein